MSTRLEVVYLVTKAPNQPREEESIPRERGWLASKAGCRLTGPLVTAAEPFHRVSLQSYRQEGALL